MVPAIGSQTDMRLTYYTRFRHKVKRPMTNFVIGAALPDGRPESGDGAYLLSPVLGSSIPGPSARQVVLQGAMLGLALVVLRLLWPAIQQAASYATSGRVMTCGDGRPGTPLSWPTGSKSIS
jgi:hypothetical protein